MASYVDDIVQEIYTKCDTKGLDALNKGTQMAVLQTAALEKNLAAIKALQHEGYSAILKNLKASVAQMGALNYGIRSANKENLKGIDLTKQAYLGTKSQIALEAFANQQRIKNQQLEAKYARQRKRWQEAEMSRGLRANWIYRNFGKILLATMGVQAIKGMVETGSRLQLTAQSIKGLTKSTQDWGFLKQQAMFTGTDIDVVAKGYRNFYAAANMAGFDKSNIQGMYADVLLATRAIGATSEQTSGALLALEQMISKGTVSMEELRRQLGNALPGAFEIGAKAMNMTTQEFNTFVRKGKLASAEFVPKFIAQLKKEYADGFKTITGTVDYASHRMVNAWKFLQMEIVQGDFGKSLAKLMNSVTNALMSPGFQLGIKFIFSALARIVDVVRILIEQMDKLWVFIAPAALIGVAWGFVSMVNGIKKMIIAVNALNVGLGITAKGLLIIYRNLFVLLSLFLFLEDVVKSFQGRGAFGQIIKDYGDVAEQRENLRKDPFRGNTRTKGNDVYFTMQDKKGGFHTYKYKGGIQDFREMDKTWRPESDVMNAWKQSLIIKGKAVEIVPARNKRGETVILEKNQDDTYSISFGDININDNSGDPQKVASMVKDTLVNLFMGKGIIIDTKGVTV